MACYGPCRWHEVAQYFFLLLTERRTHCTTARLSFALPELRAATVAMSCCRRRDDPVGVSENLLRLVGRAVGVTRRAALWRWGHSLVDVDVFDVQLMGDSMSCFCRGSPRL